MWAPTRLKTTVDDFDFNTLGGITEKQMLPDITNIVFLSSNKEIFLWRSSILFPVCFFTIIPMTADQINTNLWSM